ncbi:MAG: DUF1015 domain-containing protein [Candidatus Neomarinimicrobiota bacterium]
MDVKFRKLRRKRVVEIRPFRGLVYNPERFQDLTSVLAPPYDVVSKELRSQLLATSPFNIVNLTLGETDRTGSSQGTFYTQAMEKWKNWQQKDVVVRVSEPAIWRVDQTFRSPNDRVLTRTGFVALIRLDSLSPSDIYTHEKTFQSPIRDRKNLLEMTRTNFSPIFFVYRDLSGDLDALLADYQYTAQARATMNLEDRVEIRVSHTGKRNWIDRFCNCVKESEILIADGHHRFEAALSFHRESRPDEFLDTSFVMGYFVPASSEGLVIFPVHRGIKGVPDRDLVLIQAKLRELFDTNANDVSGGRLPSLRVAVSGKKPVRMRIKAGVHETFRKNLSPTSVGSFSVVIFEEIILKEIFRTAPPESPGLPDVRYYSREDDCLGDVERGVVQIAFLFDPIGIESLYSVVSEDGVLPPKSTYFYPKCPAGLVMHSLERT